MVKQTGPACKRPANVIDLPRRRQPAGAATRRLRCPWCASRLAWEATCGRYAGRVAS